MSNPTPIGQPILWMRQNRAGEFYDLRGTNGDDRIDILNKVGTSNENFSGKGEHHAYGYGGDDVIRGDLYAVNCLFGGAGNDRITGGNKVDILFGDTRGEIRHGNDESHDDVLFGLEGRDLLRGGLGNDRLFGGADADRIYGGAGDDFIVGGLGGDMIDGGDGIDTVSYAVEAEDPSMEDITVLLNGTMAGVEVDLSNATSGTIGGTEQIAKEFEDIMYRYAFDTFVEENPSNRTDHAGDDLFNIENVIGTRFRDILTGDDNDNVLEGGAGDDVLSGGGGDDSDTASYKSSEKFVVVFLSTDRSIFTNTVTRFEVVQPQGLPAAGAPLDLIVKDEQQNRLVRIASENDDGDIKTTIMETNPISPSDVSDAHGDLLKGIENLEGSDHDDVLGGDSDRNTLDGGVGDDYLYGGAGDDELQGGKGADRLYGGDGSDWAVYTSAEDRVVVYLDGSGENKGDAQGDIYNSINNINSIENIRGSDHDDLLTGDSNNNEIEGKAGVDTIFGGGSNDNLRGGEGDDALDGGVGTDTLHGGEGDDSLYGGNGEDSLYGGAGTNDLRGEGGNDHYYFNVGGSQDTITDGEGDNTIHFISSDIDGNDIAFNKNSQSRDLEIKVADPNSNDLLYRVTITDYYENSASTTGIGFSIYYGTEANPGANLIDIPELS